MELAYSINHETQVKSNIELQMNKQVTYNRFIISAGRDQNIILWNFDIIFDQVTPKELQKWNINEFCANSGIIGSNFCIALSFSVSGDCFLVGCPNGNILQFLACNSSVTPRDNKQMYYQFQGPIKLNENKKHNYPVGKLKLYN